MSQDDVNQPKGSTDELPRRLIAEAQLGLLELLATSAAAQLQKDQSNKASGDERSNSPNPTR
jgi:hypothetical protein